MFFKPVHRPLLGRIEAFPIRSSHVLVVGALVLWLGVVGPVYSPVSAGFITVKDAYQDFLNTPDRNELDRALRVVITTSLENGRHAEAITRLLAIKDAHPNDIRIWFTLAVAQLGDRRLTDALSSADQAIRIRPDWPVAHWLKGATLIALSRLDEAERTFDQAVRIAPEQAGVYYQRGTFLVVYRSGEPGKVAAGIADLRKAMERDAPPELVDGMLGKAYLALNDQGKAEFHLRRAFEHGTTELNLEPLADLVTLYDSTSRTKQAEDVLTAAERRRRLLPADRHDLHSGCFLIVARHAVATGQAPSAVMAAYARALAEQPGSVATRLEYARWLDSTSRNAEAVPLLREGLTNPPYHPELSAQLAWALAESSPNLKEAREWLKHALASEPSSPYLADTAAWIAYREGKFREAFIAIRPSLSLVDQIPEVAYHVGAIHAELGNTAEAVRYLHKALHARKPFSGDRQAKELLAKLEK